MPSNCSFFMYIDYYPDCLAVFEPGEIKILLAVFQTGLFQAFYFLNDNIAMHKWSLRITNINGIINTNGINLFKIGAA